MHDPVAIALWLLVSRVVSRGMVGKLPEAAGIPAFTALTLLFSSFINDIETVAGGADKGAGTAADAAGGDGIPGRVFKMLIQPRLDLFQIELLRLRFGQRQRSGNARFGKQPRVAVDQRFPLVTVALTTVAPHHQRGEEQVAPPGFGRRNANSGTETGIVSGGAGQPDNRSFPSPLQKELILVIPGWGFPP